MAHNKKQTVPKSWNKNKKGVFRAAPLPSKPLALSIPLTYLALQLKVAKISKDDVSINGKKINKLTDLVCILDVVQYKSRAYRLVGISNELRLVPLEGEPYLVLNPLYNPYQDYKKPRIVMRSFQGYNQVIPEENYTYLRNPYIFLKSYENQIVPKAIEPDFKITFVKGREKFTTTSIVGVSPGSLLVANNSTPLPISRMGRDYIVHP